MVKHKTYATKLGQEQMRLPAVTPSAWVLYSGAPLTWYPVYLVPERLAQDKVKGVPAKCCMPGTDEQCMQKSRVELTQGQFEKGLVHGICSNRCCTLMMANEEEKWHPMCEHTVIEDAPACHSSRQFARSAFVVLHWFSLGVSYVSRAQLAWFGRHRRHVYSLQHASLQC